MRRHQANKFSNNSSQLKTHRIKASLPRSRSFKSRKILLKASFKACRTSLLPFNMKKSSLRVSLILRFKRLKTNMSRKFSTLSVRATRKISSCFNSNSKQSNQANSRLIRLVRMISLSSCAVNKMLKFRS